MKKAVAQVIFGDKTTFIPYNKAITLKRFIKYVITGITNTFDSKTPIEPHDIDLKDYEEFKFYVQDTGNRKIFLNCKERQKDFEFLKKFFMYRLVVHVYIQGQDL
ncbi:hypothetical protein NEAUS04_2667 [Nematocida ausubeli]|uniref:Uncharacterized protein n=1 Tax=Nematocida ausubeli (strain ATCC PRA-371 / ERTm2) TaxID=1913371 RepID=H8ZBY8_NEMA1|nr:uncharacterized protein NESG_02070 [Nematocida ausubeli]EHY65624.1 hypothetical protein NERG_01231 [Nematocida ausubeli]KAI5134004.1 hypothetical protein NEAUS06_0871 [Nematocida ausubeli]KAI5134261.1 hypothetical protein NEAUS06_1010 [Nematocida ausubeli]KAI5139866.1 hypothetical protein NEAUS07_2662 [Nematocida ausubeli]KAI5152082.1 hypothetical protein NEAUS05_2649 [Nematocida ausubeli]